MNNKDEALIIFNKLSKKKIKNWNKEMSKEQQYLFVFFSLLDNPEISDIFNKFKPTVFLILEENAKKSILNGGYAYNLNKENVLFLYTLFLIKSFLSSSLVEKNYDFFYISTDSLLSNFIELEEKFWIFYYSKKLTGIKDMRIGLIKIYGLLIYKNLILEKKETNSNLKSSLFLSIGIFSYSHAILSKININTKPYTLKTIDNRIYLIGCSFLNISCVMRENSYSNKRITFKDLNYIEKLTKTKTYISKIDFDDIKNEYFKEYQINFEDIDNILKKELFLLKQAYTENTNNYQNTLNFYKDTATEIALSYFNNYGSSLKLEQVLLHLYNILICDRIAVELKICKNETWTKIVLPFFLKTFPYEKYIKADIGNLNDFVSFVKPYINSLERTNSNFNLKEEITADTSEIKKIIKENINLFIKILKVFNLFENKKKQIYAEYQKKNILNELLINQQKKISMLFQLYNFKIIEELNLFEKELYFPFFFDFRGRKYDDSILSVTNFKPSRYFLNYGIYEEEEIILLNNFETFNFKNFEQEITQIKASFGILSNSPCIKNAIFWILIAIGKEFVQKDKSFYYTKELLKEGVDKITNLNFIPENLEKKISINHYRKIIVSLKFKNPLKRFIHKDATASFIQNLIRIIGPKNEGALEKANLASNDKWFDTYNIALDHWKSNLKINQKSILIKTENNEIREIDNSILLFFTRKTVKKVIMTSSYDSTFFTRWKYFNAEIKKSIKQKAVNEEDLLFLFTNFFNFIENIFWDEVYLNKPSSILVEKITKQISEKNEAILNSFDSNANIIYYKTKINKIYVYIPVTDGKKTLIRRTKNFYEVDENNIYHKKIKQSVKANWAHFSDATLIRQINNKLSSPFLTIHDCFLIDPFRVSQFIQIANDCFKELDDISIADAEKKKMIKQASSIYIFI